ncbi:MAG: ABC transporter ATP-binding protein [Candidatus Aphodosoma sp.]
MIEIKNIIKSFDKHVVLKGITMNIPKGEIVSLLGPSGSGKTTLLRLLLGAIPADEGEIFVEGKRMPDLKVLNNIGYLPQNDALYENLSALDNLKFFGGIYDIDNKILDRRIDDALSLVGLKDDKNKLVSNFSGGMKKRLSLAVATLPDPDLMLLDEPTVGIDPVLRRSIWNQFKKWKAEGKTLIVSTHVMDEVAECDKAALIREGKILAYDAVDALLKITPNGNIEEIFYEDAFNK